MEELATDADITRISEFSVMRRVGNRPNEVEKDQSCADLGQQVWVMGFLLGQVASLLRK